VREDLFLALALALADESSWATRASSGSSCRVGGGAPSSPRVGDIHRRGALEASSDISLRTTSWARLDGDDDEVILRA